MILSDLAFSFLQHLTSNSHAATAISDMHVSIPVTNGQNYCTFRAFLMSVHNMTMGGVSFGNHRVLLLLWTPISHLFSHDVW